MATDIPLIYLMGPTAAGKTALSLEIASRFDCEIISVDSALVYRGMDIGTAKPDGDILSKYPHHLIDIIDPIETYSVANFCRDTAQLIKQIKERNKIPLLVGGTMLYFNASEKGLSLLPQSDPSVRMALQQELDRHGLEALHKSLALIDPEAANRIHKNDPQRILRALEVWRISGTNLSDHYKPLHCNALASPSLKLCVTCDNRSVLHQRIEQRFNNMIESGFVEEVESLRCRFPTLTSELPSMRCVGYRQVWNYLEGEYSKSTMVEKGIIATRQLAKRQLTWLRGMDDTMWFHSEKKSLSDIFLLIDKNSEFSSSVRENILKW